MGEENGLFASGYLLRAETEIIINVSVVSGPRNTSRLFSLLTSSALANRKSQAARASLGLCPLNPPPTPHPKFTLLFLSFLRSDLSK